MKKYVFVRTGEEIDMGQKMSKIIDSPFGPITIEEVTLSEKTLPRLVEEGIVSVKEYNEGTHTDIEYYITHLALRIGWAPENLIRYLDNLSKINETAILSILLKEVAIVLDKKYTDHIENSEEIYSISLTNGEITKVKDLNRIKNFRNFAAFRTLEDCMQAKEILKPIMKGLFRKGGKSRK